jgi:hypothetical protein
MDDAAGKLGLALAGLVLIGGCGLLALGGMATSATASASGMTSDAASIAASMALGDAVKTVSQASIASSAANSAANFNVTVALCLGGLLGIFGLMTGGGVAYGLYRRRRGRWSSGRRLEELNQLLQLARLLQSARAARPAPIYPLSPGLPQAAQSRARPRRRPSAVDLENLSRWMD